MEALHSRLTTGEQSGGQEHCQPESPPPQNKSPPQTRRQQQTGSPKPHGTLPQPKQSRRQHPGRKRLRHQRQSVDSDTAPEHKHEATKTTTASSPSPGSPSSAGGPSESKADSQEGTPKQKRAQASETGQICLFVLWPCMCKAKCATETYSFPHRVKAGLTLGEPRSLEEQVTESEDETRQLSSASTLLERRDSVASIKSHETDRAKDCTGGSDDSFAVKKRLALRLSRGKHGQRDSSDEKTSSLVLGSKGSTESGYFSRSESTEQTQDSPPNTSAKSYAEIILGKYGRLGHLQRMSRHHNQQPSGQEDKSIPFIVPKKQVIDHITKLITINEAVVDTTSSFDASSGGLSKFRLSQSFDERQPVSRRYGMLRRQPAIEIPIGAELTKEEHEVSHSLFPDSVTTVPDHKLSQPQPYECEACGTGCKDWEGYKKHKQSLCLAHHPRNEVVISQMGCSQLINHAVRAGASAMRKRRKEESFEFDDRSSPSLPSPALLSGKCKDESSLAYESPRRPTLQTCSVIQHTSSFEKQESLSNENQDPHEEYQLVPEKEPSTKQATRKLVPEILVTEDSNMSTASSTETSSIAKHSEKPEEFQWPQRSPSLAQLPIEKLPPKKKRLRLAEIAQSSGESSFDSISLPRSPSQDSSASYASSRSTSFEESNRPDMELAGSTPLRRSRAAQMLMVPGVHQHREMRRSASEQAPHDPQLSVLMSETRSKSFDYSCLSPERSAVGWRERRKCLLMRHTAIRDPDEEEEERCTIQNRSPERLSSTTTSKASPTSTYRSPASPSLGDPVLRNPVRLQCKEIFSQWKLSQNIQLTGGTELTSVDPVKEEVLNIQTEQPTPPAPQPYPSHAASGAARARYLPMSTGLKLEIPLLHEDYSEVRVTPSIPLISSSLELVRPVTSPAVAVRLQTDTLTLACAIYTTYSQPSPPRPPDAFDSHNIGIPTAEYRNHRYASTDVQLWPDDGLRGSGSGGNKRMLSPSNSMELPPESKQQQKRVKEEEEGKEVGRVDKASVDTCNQELKHQTSSVYTPITHVGTSYPSLQSGTCNSWCYLNYIKPNPSPLDEQKPSVYSSWSTSGYDPNPPGLSSKTALSLLQCKQRLSPSIYTFSPMTVRTTESMEQEDNRRPCSTEQGQSRQAEINTLRRRALPSVTLFWLWESVNKSLLGLMLTLLAAFLKESNEKHPLVHGDGDGGGKKCQSEDSGSNLPTCSHGVTQSPSNTCLKDKGSSIEHLRSEAHGEETVCYPDGTNKGDCEERPLPPDTSQHDEDNKDGRRDEDTSSKAPEIPHPASSEGDKPHPGGQEMKLEQKESPRRSSASAMRAAFARRRLDASTSSGESARTKETDRPTTARQYVDEVGLTLTAPHPPRPRGNHNLLSHLPLHSQQPGRTPTPLIPIGGIHMITPRSTMPLYSLESRPSAGGSGASWRLGGFPPLQRHETLEETQRDPEVLVGIQRNTRGGVQQPSSPGEEPRETLKETSASSETRVKDEDPDVAERPVYPETPKGQKETPSSETQLL
ncbi:Transcription factor HIVEP3 [Dissostichus eleginoides]|uniref:Transcription factor HIVEP3 n=1 Tax=Dissostichus eleginoides TaxID=100907 RepID=A0AAD9EWB6_DISEL|nr:Transcription factor HIVEP3 [Dissostichus eleginoides]